MAHPTERYRAVSRVLLSVLFANLAVDDPFADAQGDELVALTGDIGGFLAAQSPISAAFDAAGCT